MPRPKSTPGYCLHRPSGRAYVTINGKQHWLPGKHGSDESSCAYNRLIGEWLAAGRQLPVEVPQHTMTVSMLLAAFWRHAQGYYRKPDGAPAGELDNYRQAMRPLKKLYGSTLAVEFKPKSLKAVREEMIQMCWSRKNINKQMARIKHIFGWAVEEELIPGAGYEALCAVKGLRKHKSDARETEDVKPVPHDYIEAVLPLVSPQVRALIELQLYTGARVGELVIMRTCDIDRSAKVWIYRPTHHKTEHHGHTREIRIGPKAQVVFAPFLKANLAAHVFSPADAEQHRLAQQRQDRKTPVQPSQVERAERARHRRRRRAPRDRYDVASYRRAIARACELVFAMPAGFRDPPRGSEAKKMDTPENRKRRRAEGSEWRKKWVWSPHQLRHNAATNLRRQYGIEAARLILGHRNLTVTQIYAEVDGEKANAIMAEVG